MYPKEGSFYELAYERSNPFELIFRECFSPKCYRVVGLWTGFGNRDVIVLAFVDTFDKNLKVLGAAHS
jgi:hypothetical protein